MGNRGQRFSIICREATVEEIASRSREIGVNESESYQDGSSNAVISNTAKLSNQPFHGTTKSNCSCIDFESFVLTLLPRSVDLFN